MKKVKGLLGPWSFVTPFAHWPLVSTLYQPGNLNITLTNDILDIVWLAQWTMSLGCLEYEKNEDNARKSGAEVKQK